VGCGAYSNARHKKATILDHALIIKKYQNYGFPLHVSLVEGLMLEYDSREGGQVLPGSHTVFNVVFDYESRTVSVFVLACKKVFEVTE
jgi:hypothetical protein